MYPPNIKDSSMNNADRQKRYRDKKRNAQPEQTVTRVTPEPLRNAPIVTDSNPEPAAVNETDSPVHNTPEASLEPHNDPTHAPANLPDRRAAHLRKLQHATRTNPDKLNYGPHMNVAELEKAELKANRQPIPGDHDYVGVCVNDGTGWSVGLSVARLVQYTTSQETVTL